MTFDEAKTLLASVAVLDNRRVDATSIQMWQTILDPFTFAECMWALREFARTNTSDYLRPAHLVAIIKQKRIEYANMNPGRADQEADRWVKFEAVIEATRIKNKELRAEGIRSAVEAMEED